MRKPEWLRVSLRQGEHFKGVRDNLQAKGLFTVCEEASCPNLHECWSARTATIMIMGDVCTRGCRFCDVKSGHPGGYLDPAEIQNTADMVGMMNLRYVVLTSVDRDDLEDHGAGHFSSVIRAIHEKHPDTSVEALVPDFGGVTERMHVLAKSGPFVIGQNLETVKRLTHQVRDRRAGYELTLSCLEFYKTSYPEIHTKSSLMVGLGETMEELSEAMDDLRQVGVDVVTFGQYLQPTTKHLPVQRYYTPDEFEQLSGQAYEKGFEFVASGALVRSSYKAADYLDYVRGKK